MGHDLYLSSPCACSQPCIGTGGIIAWQLTAHGKMFHSGEEVHNSFLCHTVGVHLLVCLCPG
jgi:hypothetical protein